jgi:2-(1,2-epoxy-1,2-dihydrophenyl)acetyl-CoA isomerase
MDTVILERRGGELRITLNRPDAMNAWTKQLGHDLLAAVEQAADDDVRAVTITGAGRAFSSGADLKAGFDPTPEGHPDLATVLHDVYHPIITGLRELPKPVLAAVNGPAVGIGASVALASDLIVARESAYFMLAFVNIGLIPDGGSTAFVPARAGHARAVEMALLGERVPAHKALEWGLVNRVVSDDELVPETRALVERLASGPTVAYANAKRLLNRRLYADLEGQLEAEADAQREQGATADFIEGVLAFAEKRPPRFEGR